MIFMARTEGQLYVIRHKEKRNKLDDGKFIRFGKTIHITLNYYCNLEEIKTFNKRTRHQDGNGWHDRVNPSRSVTCKNDVWGYWSWRYKRSSPEKLPRIQSPHLYGIRMRYATSEIPQISELLAHQIHEENNVWLIYRMPYISISHPFAWQVCLSVRPPDQSAGQAVWKSGNIITKTI